MFYLGSLIFILCIFLILYLCITGTLSKRLGIPLLGMALAFGLGIVLAGGCECGWMYRAVKVQVHYCIVGIGNIIGTIILALTWDYYADFIAKPFPKANLLQIFGNYGGLAVNYILLGITFLMIILYSRRFLNKNAPIKANKN